MYLNGLDGEENKALERFWQENFPFKDNYASAVTVNDSVTDLGYILRKMTACKPPCNLFLDSVILSDISAANLRPPNSDWFARLFCTDPLFILPCEVFNQKKKIRCRL